jgi:hypothetical protein
MKEIIVALLLYAGKYSYAKHVDLKKDDVWTVKELVELADFTGTHLSFTDSRTGMELLQITKEDL